MASTNPYPGGGVIEVAGRDAGAFLQAQLMNDVRALADGDWQWSGWLTPKGRVVALAALLRFEAERYWLFAPDHEPAALAQALQRYVLRSRLELRVRADLVARGSFVAPDPAARGPRFERRGDGVRLDFSGERARVLAIAMQDEAGEPVPADPDEWAAEDLAHGLPRLRPGDSYTPQMLGLERLRAYSVRKGCYPGQEIVARTHFLGQVKRELRRIVSAAPLARGTRLAGPDGDAGEIVCSASHGSRNEALALLGNAIATGPIEVEAAPEAGALVTGFAEGLAR